MLTTFDFFFRGFIVLGVIVVIFFNIKSVRNYRMENARRTTLKYYRTWLQHVPLIANYFSSILIGFSIFRMGTLVQVLDNGEIQLSFFHITLLNHEAFLQWHLPVILIGIAGTLMYLYFSILLAMSYSNLKSNFSDFIDVKEGNHLITTGIYATVRHPMYLAEIFLPISAGLALTAWMPFLWGLLVILPLYVLRAYKEDELLEHYYGKEFIQYKSKVGRFIPLLKK